MNYHQVESCKEKSNVFNLLIILSYYVVKIKLKYLLKKEIPKKYFDQIKQEFNPGWNIEKTCLYSYVFPLFSLGKL